MDLWFLVNHLWEINMKILVTGGLGFVGHSLVRNLLAEGHEVHALGRTTHPPVDKRLNGLHYHSHDPVQTKDLLPVV